MVIGPGIELATVIHYCGREGWALRIGRLPDDWPARIQSFRAAGAQLLAIYFDPTASAKARRSLECDRPKTFPCSSTGQAPGRRPTRRARTGSSTCGENGNPAFPRRERAQPDSDPTCANPPVTDRSAGGAAMRRSTLGHAAVAISADHPRRPNSSCRYTAYVLSD